MKKKLFTFLGLAIISLFVGYTQVSADSTVANIDEYYVAVNTDYYAMCDSYYTTYSSAVTSMKEYWTTHYSSLGYNYVIYISGTNIAMTSYSNNNLFVSINNSNYDIQFDENIPSSTILYYTSTNQFSYNNMSYFGSGQIPCESSSNLVYNEESSRGDGFNKIVLPSYTNNDLDVSYPSYELFNGDIFPTWYSLNNGSYNTYTEINLNNYAYIVLSLLDYNQDTFWTNIYTQGRLCLTPVYNYGMTPRNEVLTGTQIQSCTTQYDTLTPVNVSIIQSDIDNHAVYYISAYNNEPTTIQVNNHVFAISYITQENANSPQVTIDGRSYPVIPYSQLTDSATISTDNNYISGQVCSVGDVNCTGESIGIDISDLWTQPLQLFKTLGSSITSVLSVITAFIVFLPPTLQAFLYTAFFLVVILGILKILL